MAVITRRGFLGLVATTAVCLGGGGVACAADADTELLRPPGGQDTAQFNALCLRCDRCRSICPTGVIDIATVEDGFLLARTPILNFHRGYCDFCGLCQEVCPTGALGGFDPESDKIGVAQIRSDRCVAYSGGCEECVEACPYEAIYVDDKGYPQVEPELCNGCGTCEDICPALVYLDFVGGTRRGIKVVTMSEFEASGEQTTLSEGGDD